MLENIKELISAEIKPYMENHGGSIEVISLDPQGNLLVRLHGACSDCPASHMTLDNLVSTVVKARFPEINRIIVEEQTLSREILDITLDILRGGRGGILGEDKN